MEALSRAMDAEAEREAGLDMQELQDAAAAGEMENDGLEDMEDDDGDDEEGEPSEPVKILTPEEREAEKQAGGPDVFTVQRRLRHCVRVLENFKKLGKGRCAANYRGPAPAADSRTRVQVKSQLRIPTDVRHRQLLRVQRISNREIVPHVPRR